MKSSTPLLFTALLAIALAGCASQPAGVAEPESLKRYCLLETGTRIKVPDGECVAAGGRVLTREDLERSGAQTVGDAVRRLGH